MEVLNVKSGYFGTGNPKNGKESWNEAEKCVEKMERQPLDEGAH